MILSKLRDAPKMEEGSRIFMLLIRTPCLYCEILLQIRGLGQLTEDDVIRLLREHMERQFPKTCNTCRRQFISLEDYIRNTTHLGDPVSYDIDDVSLTAPQSLPVGTHAFANCPCGNTLSISSSRANPARVWRFMNWIRNESTRRGIKSKHLLAELRDKIASQVLRTGKPQ